MKTEKQTPAKDSRKSKSQNQEDKNIENAADSRGIKGTETDHDVGIHNKFDEEKVFKKLRKP